MLVHSFDHYKDIKFYTVATIPHLNQDNITQTLTKDETESQNHEVEGKFK